MKKLLAFLFLIVLLVGCPLQQGDDGNDGKDGKTKIIIEQSTLTTETIYEGLCLAEWQDIINPINSKQFVILEIYNLDKCYIYFYYKQNNIEKKVCVKNKETIILFVTPGDLLSWKSDNTYKNIKIDMSY